MFEDPFNNSNQPGNADPFTQTKKPMAPPAQTTTQQRVRLPNQQQGGGGENKYNILNMFWLMNPKLFQEGVELLENECHFMTISYNINFGNIRIEFGSMNQESLRGHLICLNKINKFANATIYPTALFEIISGVPEVTCFEQIINYTGEDWQVNRPQCQVNTQTDGSIIVSIDKHVYQLAGPQKDMFIYALKFALNQGMVLSGQHVLNR